MRDNCFANEEKIFALETIVLPSVRSKSVFTKIFAVRVANSKLTFLPEEGRT